MSSGSSQDQQDLLEVIAVRLEHCCIRYFVTGSQASTMYGEPRFTQDIDVVIELRQQGLSEFLAAFGSDDYYLSESAVRSAVERRGMFNLIQPATGGKVDFVVAKDSDFDRSRFLRARPVLIGEGVMAMFASPEDVILKKLQWYQKDSSDRHVRDISGVLRVQGEAIDFEYIESWLERLGVADVWKRVKARSEGSNPQHE